MNNKTSNKGGRPTKKFSEKRKYRITVKMATEEYYAMKLKAKNAGVSASEIVRMAIRDCHIKARLTTEQADFTSSPDMDSQEEADFRRLIQQKPKKKRTRGFKL